MDDFDSFGPHIDYSYLHPDRLGSDVPDDWEGPTEEKLDQARMRLRIGFAIAGVRVAPDHFETLAQENVKLLTEETSEPMDPSFRAHLESVGQRDILSQLRRRR